MPLRYIMVEVMKGRTYGHAKKTLSEFIAKLAGQAFKVMGRVQLLRYRRGSKWMDMVLIVRRENRIKTVKKLCRGILSTLPFMLRLTFLVYCSRRYLLKGSVSFYLLRLLSIGQCRTLETYCHSANPSRHTFAASAAKIR
jgi:hypothetical protein